MSTSNTASRGTFNSHLESHISSQFRICGFVDGAHAARPQPLPDLNFYLPEFRRWFASYLLERHLASRGPRNCSQVPASANIILRLTAKHLGLKVRDRTPPYYEKNPVGGLYDASTRFLMRLRRARPVTGALGKACRLSGIWTRQGTPLVRRAILGAQKLSAKAILDRRAGLRGAAPAFPRRRVDHG